MYEPIDCPFKLLSLLVEERSQIRTEIERVRQPNSLEQTVTITLYPCHYGSTLSCIEYGKSIVRPPFSKRCLLVVSEKRNPYTPYPIEADPNWFFGLVDPKVFGLALAKGMIDPPDLLYVLPVQAASGCTDLIITIPTKTTRTLDFPRFGYNLLQEEEDEDDCSVHLAQNQTDRSGLVKQPCAPTTT